MGRFVQQSPDQAKVGDENHLLLEVYAQSSFDYAGIFEDYFNSQVMDWGTIGVIEYGNIGIGGFNEMYIDGFGVDTYIQEFDVVLEGDRYGVTYSRAIDEQTGNETWTMKYDYNGLDAGTAVVIATDQGTTIIGVNPYGQVVSRIEMNPGEILVPMEGLPA